MMSLDKIYGGHALRIVIGVTMLVLLLAGGASAATITVDDSGGADYTKIQDAIDNATAGDTIEVQSGTYFENVKVDKQLTLRGIGMPVVDGGGKHYPIYIGDTNGVTLEGFTATGSGPIWYNDGIMVERAHNNTLIGNDAKYNSGAGISLYGSSNNTLSRNIAHSNNNGIALYYSDNNRLIGNIANLNKDNNIVIEDSNNNTLSGNIAYPSLGFNGIGLRRSSKNTLIGNIANSNPKNGIYLISDSNYNTLIGNNVSNNVNSGFVLESLSNYNTLIGNNASLNKKGINLDYSFENTIYNNIFNNTNNVLLSKSDMMNKWNNSRQSGTNIVGGSYLGGNFWANPGGIGYSQTCNDADSDGICDSSLTLDASNIDYLPLVYNPAITPTPTLTPLLVSAVTPNSRNAQVGMPVTIFKTVINGGTGTAIGVNIKQASGLPITVSYQQWNGVSFTGLPDTPVDMPEGGIANFVITLTPTAEFSTSSVTFNVSGTNAAPAGISAVNILTMSASTVAPADVIMMSTNLNVQTAVNTPTAFAVATSNVGASAIGVNFNVVIPSSISGLIFQVNQTDPTTGAIIGPATGLTINSGAQLTFAVFVTPTAAIASDPANNRIRLQLVDGSGKVIGAQSVAVSTT